MNNNRSYAISIILPVYNDKKYLEKCIKSLINNKVNKKYEIIIVDGNSNDGSKEIIKFYLNKYPFIKMITNNKKITSISLNLGIRESNGDYIIIIGSHTEYANDYFNTLVQVCEKENADVSGSIGEILPGSDTNIARAIAVVLSDRFGVGNSLFRVGVNEIKETDSVAYGCYKRNVFDKNGLFDEGLIRNQDIEFNKRIKNKGGAIKITPKTKFSYYARSTYKDFAKNNLENGLWSVLTPFIVKDFKSQSIRHFVPLVFVLSMLLPLLFSIIKKELAIISIFILILYFNFAFLRSLYLSRKRKIPLFQILIAFLILHFSYGIGSLIGIIKILINGSKIRGKNAQ